MGIIASACFKNDSSSQNELLTPINNPNFLNNENWDIESTIKDYM